MLMNAKVLIVDENQEFLEEMESLLGDCGFEMVSAPKNGLKLLDRIQQEHPDRTDGCIPAWPGCTGCDEAD